MMFESVSVRIKIAAFGDRRAEQAKSELMLQQEEQLIAAFGFWFLAVECYPF